jgi:predicted ATPase/class 3 adenylate cyclase
MPNLYSNTVTFLFTDIEGSTRLLQGLGDRYIDLLDDHDRILRSMFLNHGGSEAGKQGDGFFFTFSSARAALTAAVAAQRELAAHAWPGGAALRVRIGLHTGEPITVQPGYIGLDVHRAARVCSAAHGGQILLSRTTRDLVTDDPPPGVSFLDLGDHRLKDLAGPQRLFQVVAEGLQRDFPGLRSLDRVPNNLPSLFSTFVGRQREMEEVNELLVTRRLLTLTGPGGVGKTRLAIQVAAEVLESYQDGVWLVELGTISDADLVEQAVASELRLTDQPGRSLLETLGDHLQAKKLLLLLDNCEHLLTSCARLADTLLRSCPNLAILTTSRQALRVAGEATYPMAPLAVPPPQPAAPLHMIMDNDAVRLFAERAQAVLPEFCITEQNAPAVVELSRHLDGIPLAIELAAACVRALSVEQIAARLRDRFRLLTGGSPAALPRHQTLRAALDWSYDLLPEVERVIFRRLSVFVGGFTLEAAEEVCGAEQVNEAEVVDGLMSLVDKSLVVAGSRSGQQRFHLLETVREYAWELLGREDGAQGIRKRHRDWYLGLVETAGPEFLHGPESEAWLTRLDEEHDNLRAALRFSEGGGNGQAGLQLATGLWRFWEIRGYLVEGRTWLEKMLAQPVGEISALRANALTGAGVLALLQGDYEAALGFHEESLALHRRLGNPRSVAYALNNLANAAVHQGDYQRAGSLYEEAVELCRREGDQRDLAFALTNLADVVARQEQHQRARQLYEESVAIFAELGDPWGSAYASDNFGIMAYRQGDLELAASLHQEAVGIYERLGDGRGVTRALSHLADIAYRKGDIDEARALYQRGLTIRFQLGDKVGIASALERLARIGDADQPRRAARLIGAAQYLREAVRAPLQGAELDDYNQSLAGLRTHLGEEEFQRNISLGRTLPIKETVEIALGQPAPETSQP